MPDKTYYSCVQIKTPDGIFTFPFAPKFLLIGIGDAVKLNGEVYCLNGMGTETAQNGTYNLTLCALSFDDFMRPRRTKTNTKEIPPYVTVHKLEELLR